MSLKLKSEGMGLAAKVRALQAVSPLSTLARGYAVLLQDQDGGQRPLTSVTDTSAGAAVTAFVEDGALELQVIEVLPGQGLTSSI